MIKRSLSIVSPKLIKKTTNKSLAVIPNNLNKLSNIFPTERHKLYSNFLSSSIIEMLFVIGPAGTGKTYMACQQAIKNLQEKNVKKIVITRPMVTNDEDLGFLPGDINDKMAPWTQPIFDVFKEKYTSRQIQNMIHEGIIECSPLAYMRGRTFNNSFVIGDEMQNTTDNQMKMFLTRLGKNSKIVITGDIEQIDSSISDNSGLSLFYGKYISRCYDILSSDPDFYKKYKNMSDIIFNYDNKFDCKDPLFTKIKWIQFHKDDIQRNELISDILDVFDEDIEESLFDYNDNHYKTLERKITEI